MKLKLTEDQVFQLKIELTSVLDQLNNINDEITGWDIAYLSDMKEILTDMINSEEIEIY
jgi:hypothetical protein